MSTETERPVISDRTIRASALCALGGLTLEGISIAHTTPATFLLFAGLGVPLLGIGAVVFLRGLVVGLKTRGAL